MKYPQPQRSINNLGTILRVKFLIRSLVVLGMYSGFTIPASAQITYEGGKPATQSTPGTFNIPVTEGTKTTGGNLFHSFGTFGLNENQVANFEAKGVQNILGRVTGGEPSRIDGKIQVIDGKANLYLMNPALGGNNYPNGNPVNFAFTNTPGSIFNAANLTTKPGESITLVGGTVISTGDIKTTGGNISIATVEGGKYVQIKADGSILRFDLQAADRTQIQNTPNPNFTPPPLAELLTGRIDSSATGVKIENGVVKLVGDPTAIANAIAAGDTISKQDRTISTGDVITRNLDASNSIGNQGGKIQIESSQAILTGVIDTSVAADFSGTTPARSQTNSGNVVLNAQTQIKTETIYSGDAEGKSRTGGNVTLSTQTGDIIVDSINTSVSTGSGTQYKSRADILGLVGGDITVDAAGLFRVIGSQIDRKSSNVTSIYAELFGRINIKHGSKSFVSGFEGEPTFINGILNYKPTVKSGFTFPDGASGTLGSIVTSTSSNGSVVVVFKDGIFQDVTKSGVSLDGLKITGKVDVDPDPKTDPSNPDQQASRQKSKDSCTSSSTTVAANPISATTRSSDRTSSRSVDPCKSEVGTSQILQILTDKN
jgi:filamentous hemagglutinin family protein